MKNKGITVYPIVCPKGHTFYPKVLDNGKIKTYEKCVIRNCRAILDRIRVKENIKKRSQFLQPRTKKVQQHTYCTICKVILFDEKTLIKHNQRLHNKRLQKQLVYAH